MGPGGVQSAQQAKPIPVFGRNGYVTSGPQYNAMVAAIRSAVDDAAAGRDRAEALDIAKARSLLAGMAPTAAVSRIDGKA
jgi:hypothetical protein